MTDVGCEFHDSNSSTETSFRIPRAHQVVAAHAMDSYARGYGESRCVYGDVRSWGRESAIGIVRLCIITSAAPAAPARSPTPVEFISRVNRASRTVTSLHLGVLFARAHRAKHTAHQAVLNKRETALADALCFRVGVQRNFHVDVTSLLVPYGQ